MIVGHIGARKGSKGVPGKNFRTLNGKPLIDWSLDQLLGNPRIDVVIVSTDDEDIYRHARSKQTLDIGMRPPELCTDTASKWMVWQHALAVTEAITGPVSVFVDLDCTSPLRLNSDIDAALTQFAIQTPDMLMSCCAARKNPYLIWSSPTRPAHCMSANPSQPMSWHASKRRWSMSMPLRPMC